MGIGFGARMVVVKEIGSSLGDRKLEREKSISRNRRNKGAAPSHVLVKSE